MAANDVNVAHNIEGHENLPQHEDSISDTRNDGDEDIPKYVGTSHHQEHITTYTTVVKRNDLAQHEIESVLLKNQKGSSQKADIFRIAQGESELLREFVIRFQKERMLLPVVPDKWAEEAFTKGLNLRSSNASRKLKENILEFQTTIWADVHNRYESKIRIEHNQLGFPTSTKGRDRDKNRDKFKGDFDADRRSSKGRFFPYERTEGRGIKGFWSSDGFVPDRRTDRGSNNIGIGDEEYQTRFQKPIRPYPSQRDPNLWCEYHGIHRHITRDYRHLREQVATSLKNGHLREFLRNRAKNNYGRTRDNAEPSKIFRGNEINGVTFSAAKKIKVSVIHSKRLREVTEDDFTFREEDTDGLLLPYNDALVISLNVLDFKIKRVLVDPRSSANIIQWRMLEQAKLTGSIILATKLLIGFNLASVTTQQETMLPTNAEEITNTTLFKEVDDGMGYNIIIGRP
nr:uncharacterized protein LOC104104775 [Nicotiana tomentosiformis]